MSDNFGKTTPFLQVNEEHVIIGDGDTVMRVAWERFGPAKKQWLLHDLARLVAREIEEWQKD